MKEKMFFVSKSDNNKLKFISKYINKHKVSNIFIICEEKRKEVFKDIKAFSIGFKDLNKSSNWLRFVNDLTDKSLLIIDNVVKFMFFGDGKKKYIKEISQSINYKIMLDVVPFFTEPYEIFYPFWFLGKSILGYNNLQSFKSNHFEEMKNGEIGKAHDFETLYEKIKDYYIQDYKEFYNERHIVEWEMTDKELEEYEIKKEKEISNFTNPIKLYNSCSTKINLIETKFKLLDKLTKNLTNVCVAINCLGKYPNMFLKYLTNKKVKFVSIHGTYKDFEPFDTIILAEMPIVKSHDWIYIESKLHKKNIIQLKLTNNNLENYFHNKIFNNELRTKFNSAFYSNNV